MLKNFSAKPGKMASEFVMRRLDWSIVRLFVVVGDNNDDDDGEYKQVTHVWRPSYVTTRDTRLLPTSISWKQTVKNKFCKDYRLRVSGRPLFEVLGFKRVP